MSERVHRSPTAAIGSGALEPAFRSIGEAAEALGLKPHVLRYWETRFPQLQPMKRLDGRRYYRPEDMSLLRALQDLLHVRGLTLKGAARALAEGEVWIQPSNTERNERCIGNDPVIDDPHSIGYTGLASAARLGRSVGALQAMVREAVARGEFGEVILAENETARQRLEDVLAGLNRLKSRMDDVRTSHAA